MIVVQARCSPSSSPAQQMLRTGWMSWTWPTWAIGPMASPLVPGEEPEEHADDAEVGKGRPLHGCARRRLLDHREGHQEHHQGRGENERPRDGLPGAEFACEQAALCVSDGCGNDGTEEQQVCPVQLPEAAGLRGGEGDRRHGADAGDKPEGRRRAFTSAQHCHRCGRSRQQCDDDGTVAGGDGGERERGQQREADDDPAGHDGQARPLDAPRRALPGEGEGALRREPRPRPPGRSR